MQEDGTDKISVVIRCRNEERWIGYAIQSCVDYIGNPEIVVVDNESTDESLKICDWFEYLDIVKVPIKDYRPGKAINLGVQNASGDYVLVLSAHSVITQFDWRNIKRTLDGGGTLKPHAAAFGHQTPVFKGKKITPRYIWAHFKGANDVNMYSEMEGRYFFHNAFSVFKRQTLLEYPFDETQAGKEDRHWANDMIEDGALIMYTPVYMKCEHHWTPNGNTWRFTG